MNLARGVHLVKTIFWQALDSGKVKGAMLDVYSREPLPETILCGRIRVWQ
jgi:glyoxylate/hydroxypyruvate reductase A